MSFARKITMEVSKSMKKVIALALSLIMVLAMGVTSFAITTIDLGTSTADDDWGFTYFDVDWDINNENAVFVPYDVGDAATLIDGSDVFYELFDATGTNNDTLSSIKVQSESGVVDVTVYKLDDYVKSITGTDDGTDVTGVTAIKTKSTWPFDDFDLEDLVDMEDMNNFCLDEDGDICIDLYFIYFDIPTYAGAKVSYNNYFTLKFRENTTGENYVDTSEKVWVCLYPYAVDEEDVENYEDEDEAMELVAGDSMLTDDYLDDLFDGTYDDVPDDGYHIMYVDSEDVDGDDTPYVIEKDSWTEIIGSTLIVGVNEDDELEVEIDKIVKGQTSISFLYDTDVDDDVQDLDEDAELSALNFLDTTNVLDSDFVITYTFPIEDAAATGDYYLYELVGDELTLVETVAVGKGDDEVEVEIEREAGDTLGQYYLSDVELSATTTDETDTTTDTDTTEANPNTGATEVVGVAVALAVISLVSAAAVTLKK